MGSFRSLTTHSPVSHRSIWCWLLLSSCTSLIHCAPKGTSLVIPLQASLPDYSEVYPLWHNCNTVLILEHWSWYLVDIWPTMRLQALIGQAFRRWPRLGHCINHIFHSRFIAYFSAGTFATTRSPRSQHCQPTWYLASKNCLEIYYFASSLMVC